MYRTACNRVATRVPTADTPTDRRIGVSVRVCRVVTGRWTNRREELDVPSNRELPASGWIAHTRPEPDATVHGVSPLGRQLLVKDGDDVVERLDILTRQTNPPLTEGGLRTALQVRIEGH